MAGRDALSLVPLAPGLLSALLAGPSLAGEAEILGASAERTGGAWRFEASLKHGDTGWDRYADAWRATGPDGTVCGTRQLSHPHVDEQPFTRSLGGVEIPEGVRRVTIEARDSVHGWSPRRFDATPPERGACAAEGRVFPWKGASDLAAEAIYP